MGSDTRQDTENQVRKLRGVALILYVGYSCHHLTIISPLTTLHSTGVSYLVDIVDIVFWVGAWF